jgi:hypothetical protein
MSSPAFRSKIASNVDSGLKGGGGWVALEFSVIRALQGIEVLFVLRVYLPNAPVSCGERINLNHCRSGVCGVVQLKGHVAQRNHPSP